MAEVIMDASSVPQDTQQDNQQDVVQAPETAQVEESPQILEKMDGMLSEDLGLILQDLECMNVHLGNLEAYQQNSQNIRLPTLCAISLCFGAILALILSNYFRH